MKESVANARSNTDVKIYSPTNATKLPILHTPNKLTLTASKPTGGSRCLTSRELEAKHSKRECFWCTEKFVPGHKCTRNQLFIMEVDEDEEKVNELVIEYEEKEQQISIHALTGLP